MHDEHERLPLTRSLEADVRSAYAVPVRQDVLGRKSLRSALATLVGTEDRLTEALKIAGFMQANVDDQPVLDWVDDTFELWAQHYPMAPTLQQQLDSLRPLAAAFAINDERFFVPGAHALHRLLDTIHNGLIGWHEELGKPATNALAGVKEALVRACDDFPSEPQVDETLELLRQKIDGHAAQLSRFDSVLLEREQTTLGADIARLATAAMLNSKLAVHQLPGSVARFIKSDWFESGIRIGEQFGVDSSQWQEFVGATQQLIDAVQPVESEDPANQRQLSQAMNNLPNTLSRQLLSLQPDNDAVAGAVGLIEYALLRNMRGEDLGLLQADPIQTPGLPEHGTPTDHELEQAGLIRGNWFAIDSPDGVLRVRLCGTLGNNLYLLFMNFLGARVMRKSYSEFNTLLRSGEARPLAGADTFCRAMVEASAQKLTQYQTQQAEEAEREASAKREQAEQQQQLADTLSGKVREQEQASAATPHGEPHRQHEQPTPDRRQYEQPTPDRRDSSNTDNYTTTDDSHTSLSKTQQHRDDWVPSNDEPYNSNTVVKLQIPMGTWMGFHDREPPMMAKVAVRDLEKDSYIFTNRDGIKLRELTVAQLIALIDRDMVDILERKSNFRDTVNQMRRDQDRLSAN